MSHFEISAKDKNVLKWMKKIKPGFETGESLVGIHGPWDGRESLDGPSWKNRKKNSKSQMILEVSTVTLHFFQVY